MTSIQGPRGAPDMLEPRSSRFEALLSAAQRVFRLAGYVRIETPIFEHTEVFERGLDANSEMVTKEMYTFSDRGSRSLTLRPEGTAPVMRAVLEHNLDRGTLPVKLYYLAPVFRHERPQASRYRQHTQMGIESIGSDEPMVDAEVIHTGVQFYRSVDLDEVSLRVNSTGHEGCRAGFLPDLVRFLESHSNELCGDCRRRTVTNPLRVFDCKVPRDREILESAPVISDYLCDECRAHFAEVKRLLGLLGVDFEEDPRLVRGLDYYTRTTFEFHAPMLGAQDAVGGGGRYDGLAEQLGGKRLPGVGFGLGVERILDALDAQGKTGDAPGLDIYIASVGDEARAKALTLAAKLRSANLGSDLSMSERSLRRQIREADRRSAKFVLVVGDAELSSAQVTVRNMSSGEESRVLESELVAVLKEALS